MTATTSQAAERDLRQFARVAPKLIEFGRALYDADGDLDWPYFLTKPYKWADEYAAWQNAGEPTNIDDHGWRPFCDEIGAL